MVILGCVDVIALPQIDKTAPWIFSMRFQSYISTKATGEGVVFLDALSPTIKTNYYKRGNRKDT
jgi:hypothetical protein